MAAAAAADVAALFTLISSADSERSRRRCALRERGELFLRSVAMATARYDVSFLKLPTLIEWNGARVCAFAAVQTGSVGGSAAAAAPLYINFVVLLLPLADAVFRGCALLSFV